jgi:glycine cleavage system aminomethyltransferase T
VSVFVPSGGAATPLDTVLKQAGAVFAHRTGRRTVINYGSAAGELAVCVSAVGLVERSELSQLVVEAPGPQLRRLMTHLVGGFVAPGGALHAGDAWWCGAGAGQVVAICDAQAARRLEDRLGEQAVHHAGLLVRDESDAWAAIELLGRHTATVLRALGAYGASGDPRSVSPFGAGVIDGIDVMWLLEADRRALALVREDRAGALWRAIEAAGRPFGISCVGWDAASRYALLERNRSLPLPSA